MSKTFNPDDFFETKTVKDVVKEFPALDMFDYTHVSLNEKLIELNHEIISKEYVDRKFANIQSYFDMEVDKIV